MKIKQKGLNGMVMNMLIIAFVVLIGSPVMYADCDMIGILVKNGQAINNIDQLVNEYPLAFDEPSDFWFWFKDTLIPRNISGYGIIYYGLNGAEMRHVYEWPNADPADFFNGHLPNAWMNFTANQVFRTDGDSMETGDQSCFYWSQQRIYEEDNLQHNAFLILGHARWASGGNNNIVDPHPFIWDYPWNGNNNPQGTNADGLTTYSMEHNGTITNKMKLRAMTEELWASWHPGETWSAVYPYKTENQGNFELVDTEAYFHWIICNIKLAGNVEEGMRRALVAMKNWDCYKNIVFVDALNMYAYRGFGALTADAYHYLVYYSDNSPAFFAVSTAKVISNGQGQYTIDPILLADNVVQIPNKQMVKFNVAGGLTTYNNFDTPRYHTLPYACNFDNSQNSTVDSYWYLNSWDDDNNYGHMQVATSGTNRYLKMDCNTTNPANRNEASFYLKLAGKNRVHLKFNWTSFSPDLSNVNGVYFSDDGGQSFTQVYYFNRFSSDDSRWQNADLFVDSLCSMYGLEMNDQFVVKFVQHENTTNPSYGVGIDNISVATTYATPNGYVADFEDGTFDEFWVPCLADNGCRIRITSQYTPYEGSYHMVLDSGINNNYVASYADLHLNFSLSYYSGYTMKFYIKDFNDEPHYNPLNILQMDAILFSDDGGQTFVPVYALNPTGTYQEVELNISQLARDNNLKLSDQFVIRFQQYDNYGVPSDGIAFDFIRISGTGPIL